MRKNIKTGILKSLLICLTAISLFGCREEDFANKQLGDKITVVLSAPSLIEVTQSRAIDASLENQIYSVYLFVTKGSSDDSEIILKQFGTVADGSITFNTTTYRTNEITLERKDGTHIFALVNANYTENMFNGDKLLDEMNGATTVGRLRSIIATLQADQVTRPQGHLLMSGEAAVAAVGQTTTIPVVHVDSRVNFNVNISDAAFAAGANFVPTSYQIINVPKKSYLVGRDGATTAPCSPYKCDWDALSLTDADDYFNTTEETYFNKEWAIKPQGVYSFDFYMMENRKSALHSFTNYTDREKKTDAAFTNAHQYASYVLIKGVYQKSDEELRDEIQNVVNAPQVNLVRRYAEVEYVVHLGDFRTENDNYLFERGKNYTYNVSVQNANNIAVECTVTDERQPSAEGYVKDSYLAFADLDAHFNNTLIHIEVPEPDTDDEKYFTDHDRCLLPTTPYSSADYSWMQFADNGIATPETMLSFTEAASNHKLIAMAKLVDYVKVVFDAWKANRTNDPYTQGRAVRVYENGRYRYFMYFTAYIDEYYPQGRPESLRADNYNSFFLDGYGPEDAATTPALAGIKSTDPATDANSWKKYIDAGNREIRLFNKPYESPDGYSMYTISQVMITQKSIQTFYNTSSVSSALGIEHVDENPAYEMGQIGNISARGKSATDGLNNTLINLLNGSATQQWSTFVNQTTVNSDENQVLNSRNYAAPVQRNRDINANGIIDASEIRWYIPARNQLIAISLAGQALRSQIYNGSLPHTAPAERQYCIHHGSSDFNRLWTEEIVSTGANLGSTATYIIATRTLGTTDNVPQNFYTVSGQNASFDYYKSAALREIIPSGEFIPMTEWDPNDRLAKRGFKIASAATGQSCSMQDLDNPTKTSPCATYSEGSDPHDAAGKWRLPNVIELAMVSIIRADGTGTWSGYGGSMMSCTKFSWAYKSRVTGAIQKIPYTNATDGFWWAANSHHALYYQGTNVTLSLNYNSAIPVRCVRDIQADE